MALGIPIHDGSQAPCIAVVHLEGRGRGVVATQGIPKNTTVAVCQSFSSVVAHDWLKELRQRWPSIRKGPPVPRSSPSSSDSTRNLRPRAFTLAKPDLDHMRWIVQCLAQLQLRAAESPSPLPLPREETNPGTIPTAADLVGLASVQVNDTLLPAKAHLWSGDYVPSTSDFMAMQSCQSTWNQTVLPEDEHRPPVGNASANSDTARINSFTPNEKEPTGEPAPLTDGSIFQYMSDCLASIIGSFTSTTTTSMTSSTGGLVFSQSLFDAIVYREKANAFGHWDDSHTELVGYGVFPQACYFNHALVQFVTERHIAKGEELCIFYGQGPDELQSERQARLLANYFFHCQCAKCQ
ncbi:hypothetical protein H4R33_005853 [Dimargaris cristalligena]|nr:hypothetical protein H4R33_005853 [Dimargaris cristalligena]